MRKLFFSMLLLTSVFTSCDKNDSGIQNDLSGNTEKQEVNLSVGINKVRSKLVRSILNDFPTGAEIGIFATTGTLGNHYDNEIANANVKATHNSGAWSCDPSIYLSNNNAKLFAYYPYNSLNGDGSAIPVEHTSQTDYLYGTHTESTVDNGNPNVRLNMNHALALLQFKLSKLNYTGAAKLTKIEVVNATGKTVLYSKGTLDISTGKITSTEGENKSAVISGDLLTIPNTASLEEINYPKIMLLPCQTHDVGEIIINFTIDDKVYTYNVPLGTKWETGTKNTYTVTIQGTAITIGDVVISDWTDGINGSINLQ